MNEQYGRLTVIGKGSVGPKLLCRCSCGNIVEVSKSNLKSGSTKSCGCLRREHCREIAKQINNGRHYKDITGQRFGKLVALDRVNDGGQSTWKCQCDCGRTKIVKMKNLISGCTKSCGCLSRGDLTNMRFGKLKVLSPTRDRIGGKVVWLCQCDCGNTKYVPSDLLLHNKIKSCGCSNK